MIVRPHAISKVLTMNDTGETGAHQAGFLVPKKAEFLVFFPELGATKKNPRAQLNFEDPAGKKWVFSFIYYNNRLFDDKGTRNEYRLTGMTAFLRVNNLKAGDTVILSRKDNGNYTIRYTHKEDADAQSILIDEKPKQIRLTLSNTWKVIRY